MSVNPRQAAPPPQPVSDEAIRDALLGIAPADGCLYNTDAARPVPQHAGDQADEH
jgi:hypothetical protein